MSPVDVSDEKTVLDMEDEPEEKENINSSAELEREKQKTNEFNVEGNSALVQFFVQNYNESKGIGQILNDASSTGNSKKYDLRQADKCVEFIEEYRDSEYVAVAIILCVFEYVSRAELPDLRKIFIKHLPPDKRADHEENGKNVNGDPYLSIDTLIGVIGGKRFVKEDGQSCISLGENSKQALINVMDSFPALHDAIVSGLMQVYDAYKSRKISNAYQMAAAFARVISVDIEYADEHIFPRLCSDPRNSELLGILMYKLYEDDRVRKMTNNILLRWLRSDSKWLWRPVCTTFILLAEADNNAAFESTLERTICRRIQDFKFSDLTFMASVLMQSMAFREMTARVFQSLFNEADKQEKKLFLASIYLRLIRYCYFRVNKSSIDLPLVVCDTGTQQNSLSLLIRRIMLEYRLRKQLYVILETYLKEISDYKFSKNMINHVAAYFHNLALTGEIYQQDVMDFLRRCEGTAAQQIYNRLQKVYEGNRE